MFHFVTIAVVGGFRIKGQAVDEIWTTNNVHAGCRIFDQGLPTDQFRLTLCYPFQHCADNLDIETALVCVLVKLAATFHSCAGGKLGHLDTTVVRKENK